jgi:predicted CXXCH cytochrome family protein
MAWAGAGSGYVGSEVCAGCHKGVATSQKQTAMALTWQGATTKQLHPNYSEKHAEGPDPAIEYRITRSAGNLEFQVQMPGDVPATYPVETTVGGQRHGLSFLARVSKIGGMPLGRAPLVETRYLHYVPDDQLRRSPGFPSEKPKDYETALGRVLTPNFEKKCLSCHGEPRAYGRHTETGVVCESCHGPGQPHLTAIGKKASDRGILNPAKLPVADQMRTCSQCHAGFSMVQDAMPDDLLISDQVTALQNTECWRQTEGKMTCVNCHNPHSDAPRAILIARSEKRCLQCHSAGVTGHAGLCPVNRESGCVECHMPESRNNPPFLITDHWIRVHPEARNSGIVTRPEWRTKVVPKRTFLRMMAFDNGVRAREVRRELSAGGSFFDLARANSTDRDTAINGGFLGDLDTSRLDPAWSSAALRLQLGEISDVVSGGGKYFIVQRMPRNFREDAEARFTHAMELRNSGNREQSAAELLEALKIYPRLLRALTYLGITYGEAETAPTGAGILRVATRLYPDDAGAHFNLGIAYGSLNSSQEAAEYKRALEIDPDYVPAYLNLGASLFGKGDYDEAIEMYRRGIQVNPLVASLHYSLGLALEKQNKMAEAKTEMDLATKIDPKVADH